MSDKKPFTVKNLILTVLHTANEGAIAPHLLVQVGHYMGITDNAIRVSLSRLIKNRKIEKDEQGEYRIRASHSLFSQHVRDWRLGEKRRVPWDGTWISCALLKPSPAQSVRKKSLRALQILGFQSHSNGLYLRPNNLADDIDTIRLKLASFGLESGAEVFVSSEFSVEAQTFFETRLWPIKQLTEGYRDLYARLKYGYAALKKKATQALLIDALILGHEITLTLTTDPLLPEKMQSPQPRIKLTQLMLEFETFGKRLWEKTIPGLSLN